MKKYLPVLKRCPLFCDVSDEKIIVLLSCLGAKVEHFEKKCTIFNEGTCTKYIGIVLTGTVQIIQDDYYGNRSIVSAVESAEMFAEAFACAEMSEIPVSVVTDEPSEIMFIDSSHILHTCSNNCGFHQQLIFNLVKALASKTLSYYQKIEFVSKRSTREKLLSYLSYQAKKNNSSSFKIPFDRQELADYLEVERSGLSAEIGKMQKEGLIKSRKNYFEILYQGRDYEF
ncbi:MAG: Crp/Fnr family transcriptional regulator [Ruminococcaceae bacterium]|nr:Crp/Fnr family transcriptional regulator [Oscillospiraceae bacterium]